jgi:hypothetical protein
MRRCGNSGCPAQFPITTFVQLDRICKHYAVLEDLTRESPVNLRKARDRRAIRTEQMYDMTTGQRGSPNCPEPDVGLVSATFRKGGHGLDLDGTHSAPLEINAGHMFESYPWARYGDSADPNTLARAGRSAVSFQPDRRPRQEGVMVSRCLLWKAYP